MRLIYEFTQVKFKIEDYVRPQELQEVVAEKLRSGNFDENGNKLGSEDSEGEDGDEGLGGQGGDGEEDLDKELADSEDEDNLLQLKKDEIEGLEAEGLGQGMQLAQDGGKISDKPRLAILTCLGIGLENKARELS